MVELVNLRCSQLNGCAYCLDLDAHAGHAADVAHDREAGVTAAGYGERLCRQGCVGRTYAG